MPIKIKIGRGLIYAGDTPLASTLVIEQTGPMQLTVRAGSFTTTGQRRKDLNGTWLPWIEQPETAILATDQVFLLAADAVETKHYQAELGVDALSTVDVLLRSRRGPDPYPASPVGWRTIHLLIFEFEVPPGTVDLTGLDINVLTVKPGFPEGTTAADFQTQMGGV